VVVGVALALCLPMMVFAATSDTAPKKFTPELPLPGIFTEANNDSSLMSVYIRATYIFFVWIVGLLGVIMIIYGGIRWVAARGNAGQIKEARETVTNAIAGVMLALLTVVLLNTISPKLTNLATLNLGSSVKDQHIGLAVTSVCPLVSKIDDNVPCGDVVKTGSIVDANGKTVDSYCVGTVCPYGYNFPWQNEPMQRARTTDRRVCMLRKDEKTTYFAPNGSCVPDVPIQSTAGESRFIQTKTASVTQIPFNLSFGCGHVSPISNIPGLQSDTNGTPYRFGYACRVGLIEFAQQPSCYIIGTAAIVKEAWVDGGQAQNAFCPPVKD
jgi:uncharacterized membrane protein